MDSEFITILRKLITEQGKEVLFNPSKCKAFLADYTHGEYKKESRLLIQTIEAGVPKAIDTSGDLSQCKQQQIKVLHEEFFVTEEIAKDIIDTLLLILSNSREQTILSSQEITTGNEIKKQIPTNMVKVEQLPLFWIPWIIPFILSILIYIIIALVGHS